MSLAIVGFACVALIGMIPMGLTSFHQAMGNTIEADIVQNLSNDMLLANFSDLYQYSYRDSGLVTAANAGQTYYFDAEGTPIPTTTPTTVPSGTVYTAVVTLTPISSSATTSTSNSPAGLIVSTYNNGISTNAPPTSSTDTTWSNAFSGLTSGYTVTITIASFPSVAAYTSATGYTSVAAFLSAYALNTGGTVQSSATRAPDQFSFVIANNNL